MRLRQLVPVCTPLPTRLMAGLLTTFKSYPTRQTLHSWPGQETFDDVDVDDFECDEDDLPGLRTLSSRAFTVH
jgi:hypothetical protein